MPHRIVRFTLMLAFSIYISIGATAAVADPSACLNCHAVDEFAGMDTQSVADALADPAIPSHGRFAGLTEEEEEVETLLAALAAQ